MRLGIAKHGGIPYYLMMSGLVVGLLAAIFSIYLMVWPFKTIVPQTQPYVVETKTVKPGESLTFIVDICRYTNAQATISAQLVGDAVVYLPARPSNLPKGCGKYRNTVIIPAETPPGIYKLVNGVSYPIGFPGRHITVTTETEKFTVSGTPPPAAVVTLTPQQAQDETNTAAQQQGPATNSSSSSSSGTSSSSGSTNTTTPKQSFLQSVVTTLAGIIGVK